MIKVAVIGSGTMGNGIAHVFGQYGYKVSLVDISDEVLQKAIATIQRNLSRQVEKEIITEDVKTQAIKNIVAVRDLNTGVKDADLIVEAATENNQNPSPAEIANNNFDFLSFNTKNAVTNKGMVKTRYEAKS